jgi:peptidyl-prolyl cis-trans isomerase D
MMQAIRTRAGSIIVKVLFGLLIVSFGFWGIYTRSPYFQSRSPSTVIATVGDQDIRAGDVQKALEPTLERLRAQLGAAIDQQQVKQLGILDGVVSQLVDQSLLDQETGRLGLAVPDTVIRDTIYENPAFRTPDGRFDRQRFEELLTRNRITEQELIQRLRRDIPRTDMLQSITAGVTVPRSVVDTIYRYRNEKRVADIVAFPAAAVKGVGQPSEAALTKFYDAHKDLFRAPEYRSFLLASLSPKDLEPAAIRDSRLRQAYEARKDAFVTPERRDIQQILAPSEAKAKEAEAALKTGGEWREVATKIAGQDPSTIDLGLLSPKEIPHELGDVAFRLPLNQPSQPIKSPLGWHILRVVKIQPASEQSFTEAKPKLEAELKLQDAVTRVDKIGNQADDALAGGATLAEVAKKYGLKTMIVTADESGQDRNGKKLALSVSPAEVLKTAFATNRGETSRITDTNDGAIFAVRVTTVTPPAVRPLAAVKDKATLLWQAEEERAGARKAAKALAASVKPDLPLAKAAGAQGLTVRSAVTLGRSAPPTGTIPPTLVAELFAAKPGAVVSASDESSAFVAQLKEIEIPKKIPEAAAQGLSDQLGREAKLDLAGEFTAAMRRQFPVEIKRDALDRMF